MEQLPKLDQAQLQERIKEGKYILFFTADWCPDCNFIKPAMPAIEQEFPEWTFLQVDRDENLGLAVDLGIMGIPSFVAYENGQEVGRFVNKDRKTKQEVETFIQSL